MNGKCMCGKVTYKIKGRLGEVRLCHCTQCRKVTGTAFSANANIPKDKFELTTGTNELSEYEQSTGVKRYFCSNCGSQMYVLLESEPDSIRPRLGSIEGIVDVDITSHVWVSSKSNWYEITDKLTQHLESAAV